MSGMSSYMLFAWRDAMELANWLENDFDVRSVRKAFDSASIKALRRFELENQEIIAELISKTPRQRPPCLRRVGKNLDELSRAFLVLFAAIGQVRAHNVLDLRDQFEWALSPGSSNRSTCAGAYQLSIRMAQIASIKWPDEVFHAYGGDDGSG